MRLIDEYTALRPMPHEMQHKHCTKCGEEKPTPCFSSLPGEEDTCRACSYPPNLSHLAPLADMAAVIKQVKAFRRNRQRMLADAACTFAQRSGTED